MKRLTTFLIASFLMLIPMAVFGQDYQKGGKAYRSGEYATALREWLALAQQGNPDTQFNLGVMYWNGDGVSEDDLMAYMWWNLATAQGHQDAAQWKTVAAKRLTQQQLEKAQRLASACKENNYKGCGQGGLGVRVTMNERGFLWIASLIDGDTPAARAGIKAGDFITQVDGGEVLGLSLSEAVDRIRGPVGTDIQLTIWRKDAGFQKLSVTRGITPLKSVASTSSGQNPDSNPASANMEAGAFNPVHLAKLKSTGSCQKCNLAGADLRNISITNLEGANLSGANFSGAELGGVEMSHANLSGADFTEADLSRAVLYSTNLRGANLSDAQLSYAKLDYSNLRNANLGGADLTEATLSNANLVDANLSGAELNRTDFRQSNAARANFSDTEADNADFPFSNLAGANFQRAQLREVDFGCNIYPSYLFPHYEGPFETKKTIRRQIFFNEISIPPGSKFCGLIFSPTQEELNQGSVELINVGASGANLSEANFSGAKIDKVSFSFANLSGANLKGMHMDLWYSDLRFDDNKSTWMHTNLRSADLRKSDLRGSDMTGANLSGADLRDTRLQGIKLDDAILCRTKLPWGEENGGC